MNTNYVTLLAGVVCAVILTMLVMIARFLKRTKGLISQTKYYVILGCAFVALVIFIAKLFADGTLNF